ncbi:endonuclease/exonuclease/phosphatase family protein [Actinomadura scrupuli]|uniref:endonuclease/exonuclease/phosphatase family protein n=1 Tax=Actinomadura scrupuli TaxID=559629 RepID=UPI003D9906D4
MTKIRLVGYNVRALRDDGDAVARVLRGCRPDLVCLQEVPRFLGWQAKRERLAEACGLTVASGRRTAGLAVLAGPRVQVLHDEYHLLTRVPGLHRRALAIAVVEIDGARLVAASTHLDLADTPRRAHVGEVIALLDRVRRSFSAPVVLAGDINEEPLGPAWGILARTFQDACAVAPAGETDTYSARRPVKRIDGVFADRAITVAGCGVPAEPELAADYAAATDHRPVLADLVLG